MKNNMEKPPLSSKEKPEKSSFFSKKMEYAESLAKVLALSALIAFSSLESKAQETKNEAPKESYPGLIMKARAASDSLYKKLLSIRGGGVATISPGTTISFDETTTGYKIFFAPGDSLHPSSTYLEVNTKDNCRIYYIDENADGKVDRILMDADKEDGDLEKNINHLNTNKSIEDITNGDEFAQKAMGVKDISVFEINQSGKQPEVQILGFKENKQGKISGEDAKKFVDTMQKTYTEDLESMIQ